MDFTMRHPNHHHPHYEQSNGASSSAAAARCPAFRVAAEQGNYQRPTISPARSSVQYEPGHRNLWQSRSPQNWRPAMISPYTQDSSGMGTFSAVASNQPVQSQQPLCPMPVNSNAPNVSEAYTPQIAALQQFRPTMHPAPRLLGQSYQGFGNQSNTQHPSNRSVHRANAGYTGLPASGSMHSAPPLQNPASRPSVNPIQIGQTAPFTNENRNPSQQLPNLPQMFTTQNPQTSLSRQTPEPATQATGPVEDGSSRPGKLFFLPCLVEMVDLTYATNRSLTFPFGTCIDRTAPHQRPTWPHDQPSRNTTGFHRSNRSSQAIYTAAICCCTIGMAR